MNRIYLDNSATTPLRPEAKAAMSAAMEIYGNPSSLHAEGLAAASLLKQCREQVGQALGERFLAEGQLIFTSCGSEADALILQGCAHAKERRKGSVILTTDSEHPAVENNLQLLGKEGFTVVRVPTKGGELDFDLIRAHCNGNLFMVSMMLVNNETGARYPLEQVFAMAKEANPAVICHTDAVQAFMKVPFTLKSLGADAVSVSAHKIGGPKGVGALLVKPELLKSKNLTPFLLGGGQEFGYRSGTENTVGIAGFAAAAKAALENRSEELPRLRALSQKLIDGLAGSGIRPNLSPVTAPHVVSITLPDVKSETMLHYLSEKGIDVSAGSACSAHKKAPSRALLHFGLKEEEADTTLRISFGACNTESDVDALLSALFEGVNTLIKIHH